MIDEFASSRTGWVESHFRKNEVTYFDTFGVEYIPIKIQKIIRELVTKMLTLFRVAPSRLFTIEWGEGSKKLPPPNLRSLIHIPK